MLHPSNPRDNPAPPSHPPSTFAEGLAQAVQTIAFDRAAGIDPFAGPPTPLTAKQARLKARRQARARREAAKLDRDHCVICGEPPFIRHLDKGWMCVDCAAREGNPLAMQLKGENAILSSLMKGV